MKIKQHSSSKQKQKKRNIHALSTILQGWFLIYDLSHLVKALLILVRWATGKRLTNHQPKVSLIKFSPLGRKDIQVQTQYTGRHATNSRFQFLGAQGEYLSVSWHEETRFSLKSVLMVNVTFELTTSTSSPFDDATC